jgi:hypothetical protein
MERRSLLAGRNQSPLSQEEILRASNTFLGLDSAVSVRHVHNARTAFRVARDDTNDEYGEVVFGPDIYPGRSVVDPNSALSLTAAAAHELTHFHRWRDMIALPQDAVEHLDEAFTSLQAIFRYQRHLSEHDILQLVADSIQRLQLYVQSLERDS